MHAWSVDRSTCVSNANAGIVVVRVASACGCYGCCCGYEGRGRERCGCCCQVVVELLQGCSCC